MSFRAELGRRKIFQVAAVYGVTAWLLVQIAATVEEPLTLPPWFDTAVIVLLALGFPVTLILSWAFDLTSEGLIRDRGARRPAASDERARGRTIEYVLIGLLVVAVGWVVYRVELGPGAVSVRAVDAVDVLPNSVAVLPFDNLSPNPDDAFFATGIHQEVISQLAKIGDLNVTARPSVMRYAQSALSVGEIADELRVETIVEGSVRYADDRVRLNVELIEPATEANLWSNAYQRGMADIFAIQTDIARQIATTLEAEMLPEERANIERAPTESADAYAWYLRALNLPNYAEFPITRPAHVALLDQVLAVDPSFAPAYARKARIYSSSAMTETLRLARENAERALELDPGTGMAYVALGRVHRQFLRAEEQRAALRRGLELGPTEPLALAEYGRFLSHVGEHEEAIRMGERAVEVDPNNATWRGLLSGMHAHAGDLDTALARAGEARELRARTVVHAALARLHVALGNRSEARESLRLAKQGWASGGIWILSDIVYASGRLEDDEQTQSLRDRLGQMAGDSPQNAQAYLLIAALSTGDRALAHERLTELVRIVTQTTGPVPWGIMFRVKHNVYADPILAEPRFVELRSRLGYRDRIEPDSP